MNKKLISFILALSAVTTTMSSLTYAEDPKINQGIVNKVNNITEKTDKISKRIRVFSDKFITKDSRTYVPLRSVLEDMGAAVYWLRDENKTIQLVRDDTVIIVNVNNNQYIMQKMTKDGSWEESTSGYLQYDSNNIGEENVKAFMSDGKDGGKSGSVYVPLRAIPELFNKSESSSGRLSATVGWTPLEENGMVIIEYTDSVDLKESVNDITETGRYDIKAKLIKSEDNTFKLIFKDNTELKIDDGISDEKLTGLITNEKFWKELSSGTDVYIRGLVTVTGEEKIFNFSRAHTCLRVWKDDEAQTEYDKNERLIINSDGSYISMEEAYLVKNPNLDGKTIYEYITSDAQKDNVKFEKSDLQYHLNQIFINDFQGKDWDVKEKNNWLLVYNAILPDSIGEGLGNKEKLVEQVKGNLTEQQDKDSLGSIMSNSKDTYITRYKLAKDFDIKWVSEGDAKDGYGWDAVTEDWKNNYVAKYSENKSDKFRDNLVDTIVLMNSAEASRQGIIDLLDNFTKDIEKPEEIIETDDTENVNIIENLTAQIQKWQELTDDEKSKLVADINSLKEEDKKTIKELTEYINLINDGLIVENEGNVELVKAEQSA